MLLTVLDDLALHIQHALHLTAPHVRQPHLGDERLPEVVLVVDGDGGPQSDQEGHVMLP